MHQWLFTLFLGFVLGIKHAFDADHLIAVSTLVSRYKNPLRAAFVGTFWGIGHTISLFVIGILVLLLRITIPETISLSFEFFVGMILVALGIKTLSYKDAVHTHTHIHDRQTHTHFHPDADTRHYHQHRRSMLIGMFHGMAGSGALTILVLSTISSVTSGILYILIFGLGSIIGMSFMSMLIGLPFIFTKKNFPSVDSYLKIVVGILSVLFGLSIMYEIGRELKLF